MQGDVLDLVARILGYPIEDIDAGVAKSARLFSTEALARSEEGLEAFIEAIEDEAGDEER